MATFGISPNMTLYMMNEYHMEMKTTSNVLFMWSSTTNFMLLIGAVVFYSFLGRFYTIDLVLLSLFWYIEGMGASKSDEMPMVLRGLSTRNRSVSFSIPMTPSESSDYEPNLVGSLPLKKSKGRCLYTENKQFL